MQISYLISKRAHLLRLNSILYFVLYSYLQILFELDFLQLLHGFLPSIRWSLCLLDCTLYLFPCHFLNQNLLQIINNRLVSNLVLFLLLLLHFVHFTLFCKLLQEFIFHLILIFGSVFLQTLYFFLKTFYRFALFLQRFTFFL